MQLAPWVWYVLGDHATADSLTQKWFHLDLRIQTGNHTLQVEYNHRHVALMIKCVLVVSDYLLNLGSVLCVQPLVF